MLSAPMEEKDPAPSEASADDAGEERSPEPDVEADAALEAEDTAVPQDDLLHDGDVRRVLTIQRATWELELLISGAVVFSLFQLPSLLARWFFSVDRHLSKEDFFYPFFLYYGSTLAVIALIAGFSIHFLARGFWVAICGLNEVFPEGVRWEKLDIGPRGKRFQKDYFKSAKELEKIADRFASSVFSILFSILISLFAIFSLLFIAVATVGSLLRWLFPNMHTLVNLYSCLLLVMAPGLVSGVIESWFKKKPEREEQYPRLARWAYKLLRFNALLIGHSFHAVIPLTFQSYSSTRKGSAGFGALTLLLAVVFMAGFLLQTGVVGWDSYVYFPVGRSADVVSSDHYEDRRDPESRARIPVIESEVVEGSYLRLFIPFRPSQDNELLEYSCPDLEPVHKSGLYLNPRARDRSDELDFSLLRACLQRVWTVWIDGTQRNVDYVFHRHPVRKTVGALAQIPVQQLEAGRHLLEVRRSVPLPTADAELPDDAPGKLEQEIVFWK
ncbi:MAG: hypothetical protein AAGK22_01890 [Acidobacteriota bacterium]